MHLLVTHPHTLVCMDYTCSWIALAIQIIIGIVLMHAQGDIQVLKLYVFVGTCGSNQCINADVVHTCQYKQYSVACAGKLEKVGDPPKPNEYGKHICIALCCCLVSHDMSESADTCCVRFTRR